MQDKNTEPSPAVQLLEAVPRQSTPSLFIASAAMLIAIISLVCQFFFWEINKHNEERINSYSQIIQDRIALSNLQIQNYLQPKLEQLNNELQKQQRIINSIAGQSLSVQRKKILISVGEANHLTTLANYSLLFENNINVASQLLTGADQRLQEINDANVTRIRSAIADAITALNAAPKVDISGISARLTALNEQVSTVSNLPSSTPAVKMQILPLAHLTWKERLMTSLQNLKGIITIRRMPEEIKPLASPEYRLYLVQSIRLQLSQAQWALLRQNSDLYQESLARAKTLLQKYDQTIMGIHIIRAIEQLQRIDINPPKPDLSHTITLLNEYLNTLQQADNVSLENQQGGLNQQPPLNQAPSMGNNNTLPYATPPVTPPKQNLSAPNTHQIAPQIPRASTNSTPRALPS